MGEKSSADRAMVELVTQLIKNDCHGIQQLF
jgi:hypothetical protein